MLAILIHVIVAYVHHLVGVSEITFGNLYGFMISFTCLCLFSLAVRLTAHRFFLIHIKYSTLFALFENSFFFVLINTSRMMEYLYIMWWAYYIQKYSILIKKLNY